MSIIFVQSLKKLKEKGENKKKKMRTQSSLVLTRRPPPTAAILEKDFRTNCCIYIKKKIRELKEQPHAASFMYKRKSEICVRVRAMCLLFVFHGFAAKCLSKKESNIISCSEMF